MPQRLKWRAGCSAPGQSALPRETESVAASEIACAPHSSPKRWNRRTGIVGRAPGIQSAGLRAGSGAFLLSAGFQVAMLNVSFLPKFAHR